jgi:mRNA-degrading endonuclease RelE of RelBE toxin-antitoxin system
MNQLDHPDLYSVDLPRLESEFGDEQKFEEFLAAFDKTILQIKKDPASEGAPLTRPPLATYRKKKFHSQLKPPQGDKADMRLLYRFDPVNNTLYVLGVGKRRPYQSNDIYALLNIRSPI